MGLGGEITRGDTRSSIGEDPGPSASPVRWGVIGTGCIAASFAEALAGLPDAETLAVGTRSRGSATDFAEARGLSRPYGSYAELAADPDVLVVYVATPHTFHAANVEQFAVALEHEGGGISALAAATRTVTGTATPQEATVLGTEGYARLHGPWWRPAATTISKPGEEDALVEEPVGGNGFGYEAAEVMRCLRAGETESAVVPLDETISVLQTVDGA